MSNVFVANILNNVIIMDLNHSLKGRAVEPELKIKLTEIE
jgi:hypothetical protein